MLAESRFPSELKKDSLYIGNFMNVLTDVQLNLLGIRQIMYLTPKRFEDLDKNFVTEWFEMKEQDKPIIDFDSISLKLGEMLA